MCLLSDTQSRKNLNNLANLGQDTKPSETQGSIRQATNEGCVDDRQQGLSAKSNEGRKGQSPDLCIQLLLICQELQTAVLFRVLATLSSRCLLRTARSRTWDPSMLGPGAQGVRHSNCDATFTKEFLQKVCARSWKENSEHAK